MAMAQSRSEEGEKMGLKAKLVDSAGTPPVVVGPSRELDKADLAMRSGGAVSQPSSLQKLHARHHALARALAQGMRPGVAGAIYGYSASRVSILQSDPSFRDLVQHYIDEEGLDAKRINERLEIITQLALDELMERFETEPEKLTVRELERLAAMGADRTGHGPKATTETNINIGFGERLRAAQERLNKVRTIEGEVIPPEAAE